MAVISSIQIDTSSAKKSIADLEKELQETNEQLKQVDINSDAFKTLQKKAAEAKGQLDRINQTTDTLSKGFQGFGENLAKVTGGISGGITAATAALQLLGVENENVLAGIAKLQQLMAFTQGISSLKDLGSGFSALIPTLKSVVGGLNGVKGALIGTGIGAAVVAVGLLIANWDKLTEKLNEFVGVSKDVNVVTAALDGFLAGAKQTAIALGNAIVQYVKTPFETVINSVKAFSEESGSIFDKIKAAGDAAAKTVKDNAKSITTEFSEIGTKASAAYNDSVIAQDKKAQEERTAAAIKAAEERAKKVAEAEKAAREKAQLQYNITEKELQIEEEKNKRLILSDEEAYNRQLEIAQRRLENIKKLYGEESLEYEKQLTTIYNLKQQYTEKLQTSGDSSSEEGEENTEWSKRLTDAQEYYNTITELQYSEYAAFQQNQADKLAALQEYYSQGLISAEQYTTASKKLAQDEKNYKIKMSSQAASGIASILTSLADTLDSNNEKQFKAQKALQISAATIQMLVGITTALSGAFTTKTGPWDIALAAIQATTIAASGAAQIAQIARTKYDSSGSSSSSISASAASSIVTPPTQYSSAVEGVEIESSIADSRVYVVESDIQQTGSRVSVQETENRY